MGTWDTGILDNDNAMDLYAFFEKTYNKQEEEVEIIKHKTILKFGLINEINQPIFGSEEWLAYAQICWEYKVLDKQTLNAIKTIFENKDDVIEDWGDLADKRMQEINDFYIKIQTPPKRKKRIKKEYLANVPFVVGDCILNKCEEGKYTVMVLLVINKKNDKENMRTYFFATTRIYSEEKPKVDDVLKSHFLMVNYGKTWEGNKAIWNERPNLMVRGNFIGTIKNENEKKELEDELNQFEVITNLNFKIIPEFQESFGIFNLDQSYQLKSQLEWEKINPNDKNILYPIRKYIVTKDIQSEIKKKNKWQFWK